MRESSELRRRLFRPAILVATVLITWAALFIGQQFDAPDLREGQLSPETYRAPEDFFLVNKDETAAAKERAANDVPPTFNRNADVDQLVLADIAAAFTVAKEATLVPNVSPLPVVTTSTTIPDESVDESTTTSSTAPEPASENGVTTTTVPATTTTTIPVDRTASVIGRLYIDMDEDELFSEADFGLPEVRITVYDAMGTELFGTTGSDGTFLVTGIAPGPAEVLVNTETVPDRLDATVGELLQTVETLSEVSVEIAPVAFVPIIASVDDQALALNRYEFSEPTRDLLVQLSSADVVREMLNQASWLDQLEDPVLQIAAARLSQDGGILEEDLTEAKAEVRQGLRPVTLTGADQDIRDQAAKAATEIAAEFLQANRSLDEAQLEIDREAAITNTPDVTIPYQAGDLIVEEGQVIDAKAAEALALEIPVRLAVDQRLALLAVTALLVATLFFYLARFRPVVWGQLRRLILFGLLIVLAATAARGVAVFSTEDPAIGFLVPAAAFGLMAAILFDARIAVLMSMAVGGVTAIATLDPGYTLFAILATLAPVPYVSSISARGELRKAVGFMTVILAVTAAAVAWFFIGSETVASAAAFGAVNGILSGLVGIAALSFLEIIFDITTSLRLLDLTDRNHPALRLLEDKAPGTFNHALMVGTLADRGAKAIGANNLLARAAAYYHDLGKTENPRFFIENQFGIPNPHDQLPPEESANVIRQHVIDGVRLARGFRIPADVADGVVSHHGDAVMRFFYSKAIDRYGEENVDVEAYRHAGRKPQSKEMAIVMMADSIEGACRAIFQQEEPTEKRIVEVVETIVGEKMTDGQLSECSLTLGDLTAVKAAMSDALNGHYHQRIPYPNFPQASTQPDGGSGTPDPSNGTEPDGEDDDSESDQSADSSSAEQSAE